jgi:hypothetical protein
VNSSSQIANRNHGLTPADTKESNAIDCPMRYPVHHGVLLAFFPIVAGVPTETLNVLVLLVQWANHDDRALIPKEHIEQLWNGPSYSDIVPGESISDYIESNTYGKYNIQADVVDWYRVDETEEEGSFGNMGNSVSPAGPHIEELLAPIALEAIFSDDIRLSKYDRNNDGYLRGVVCQTHQTSCKQHCKCLRRSHIKLLILSSRFLFILGTLPSLAAMTAKLELII